MRTFGKISAAIAVTLVVGAAALATTVHRAAPVSSAEAQAAPGSEMRLCIGPARVTLGGERLAALAFGGEGCRSTVMNVVGFAVLRTGAEMALDLTRP